MKLYGKYFKKYKVPFLIAAACVTLEAICDLLGPTLMSHIINNGIEKGSQREVYFWGAVMLLVTLIGACFAVSRNILSSSVSQRMGADLRADLYEKVMSFSEVSADKIESGSLITRMTNDTSQIVLFVNGVMRIFLKAPILCIGSMVLAGMLNFRLSLIIYGVVAVIGLLIYISMRISYSRFYRLQKAIDQVNLIVQEYLLGVRLVKAFGTFKKEEHKFAEANRNLMQKGIASQMIITIISPLLTLAVGIGTVIVIYIGSRLFTIHLADTGDMTAFTIYMAQILTSLIMITNVFTVFVRTKASTARIGEVFDCEEDFKKSKKERKLGGSVTFEHVTFAYPGGSGLAAVEDLSFSVGCGEQLAVIGPTGSGKSTIVWLLLHFYDVDKGRILLDHYDINTLGTDEVRSNIALVPQKSMLFSGSVAENLRWGDKRADLDALRQAADKAEADFIMAMPDGYDSLLGGSGVNLSGGQKQRLSIARGLLKKAPVLILDDTTSALDAVTEARVRDNLRKGKNGGGAGDQTVIMFTQRCTTAMFADKILVLEDGKKVGFGTHEELLKSCGIYQDIYHTQIESSREA